jgi:sigma-B regulation protein RsbU (phosphoserine phosphatase)
VSQISIPFDDSYNIDSKYSAKYKENISIFVEYFTFLSSCRQQNMSSTQTNIKPYVLVVDDVLKNLKVIGNILLENDYEISLVSNGFEALELLKTDKPDLILLDIMMPEMDGYEVCKKLKANIETKDIPVIFITAKAETDDIVEAFKCGGVDYITKPFNREELLVRVKTHVDLKRSRDASLEHAKEMSELNLQLSVINEEKQALLETLEADLGIAADYIQSLLPQKTDDQFIKADWMFIPAATLGGDSFGFHWLDENHLAMYLLDVCGHGVGPALHSVSVLNNLRSRILPNTDFKSPKNVISNLNQIYQMKSHNNIYFTMWYGVYNKQTEILKYASAGHPPALLINKYGEPKSLFRFLENVSIQGKDELHELYKHQIEVNGSPQLDDDFSILKIIIK